MRRILTEMLAKKSPLILSGAMGTELERRGIDIGLPLWSANALVHHPEVGLQIHKDYIQAGADIIVTNTFRTNQRVFKNANLPDHSLELTTKAVQLARQARDTFPDREILIAGCIAPVEDCYHPELVPNENDLLAEHTELAGRLAELGVDFFLVETMTTIREAYAACKAAKATGKEVVVSFTCKKDGTLYGGEQLTDAIKAIAELQPTMFSLNCISPRYLTPLIHQLKSVIGNLQSPIPFAVYGNIGKPEVREGAMARDVDEKEYARFALEWRNLGASVIGGCCGTTPEYIRRIASIL
ncbi:MAG: homocysteine S-methyltransferase family protein [Bacteroidetes bacterium]|nr:homocysteine S-methyltransferase family protein [Bacteroidota bacterium]MCW5894753.1 homocysteine S-methyltransferase family protein [Bacteroidota bacterium]